MKLYMNKQTYLLALSKQNHPLHKEAMEIRNNKMRNYDLWGDEELLNQTELQRANNYELSKYSRYV